MQNTIIKDLINYLRKKETNLKNGLRLEIKQTILYTKQCNSIAISCFLYFYQSWPIEIKSRIIQMDAFGLIDQNGNQVLKSQFLSRMNLNTNQENFINNVKK